LYGRRPTGKIKGAIARSPSASAPGRRPGRGPFSSDEPTDMFRRLMIVFHHFTLALREAAATFRGWLSEWLYVLTIPFRAIRLRYFAGMVVNGVTEILLMFRLVRPREFSSELVGGGWEVAGLIRRFFGGILATATAFFWLLVWAPRNLIRFAYYGPRELYFFLRTRTPLQLACVLAAVMIVFVGSAGTAFILIKEHRRTFRISCLQRAYDGYLLYNHDREKLEKSLTDLVAEMPDDTGLAHRLAIVRSGEVPTSEPKLVRFFMRYYMAHGRRADSVREAQKLLESAPDDWEARIFLSRAALASGDKETAKRLVSGLPHAEDAAGSILPFPSIARDSIFLFNELGLQSKLEDMLEFMYLRILPDLRSREMVHFAIPHKLFLVQCYYLCLTRLDKRPQLTQYWAPLELAFQSIVDDPAADPVLLAEVGQAGQRENLKWLKAFRDLRLISQDEYLTMARDVADRQLRLWDEVIRRDPKLPTGYVGKAELLYSCNQPATAEQALAEGLLECGSKTELIIAAGKLLQLTDPQRGLSFFERHVHAEDMNTVMCSVMAELAAEAGRYDKAISACERALKLDPKQDWARLRMATHLLRLSRPAEAAEILRPIRLELLKHPEGCADYVRALCETGADQEADEFLERTTKADCPVAVLVKTAEGLQAAGRYADAVRWAERAREKEPRNIAALLAFADSSCKLADRGDSNWDHDRVRQAIDAYRRIEQQGPPKAIADRAANNIAWLQLKVLRLPQEAFQSATRLRLSEHDVDIKSEHLETLGAVYIGVHQFDKAIEMLEQAVRTSGPRASFSTHLALAHHGLGHQERADHYLKEAAELQPSPAELTELREATKTVKGR
jgi:predicted Zn-dependent protease